MKLAGPAGPPAEAHLNILHAQDVPAIIHVLLEVFVLERERARARERERERERDSEDRKSCRLTDCNRWTVVALVLLSSTLQRVMNNNDEKYIYFSICAQNNRWVMQDLRSEVLLVSPGTRTPVWATCLCGRYRAVSQCWRVLGPSVTKLDEKKEDTGVTVSVWLQSANLFYLNHKVNTWVTFWLL